MGSVGWVGDRYIDGGSVVGAAVAVVIDAITDLIGAGVDQIVYVITVPVE